MAEKRKVGVRRGKKRRRHEGRRGKRGEKKK